MPNAASSQINRGISLAWVTMYGPAAHPKAMPKICALYAIAVAVVRSWSGNQVDESSGGQLMITGPAAALTAWPRTAQAYRWWCRKIAGTRSTAPSAVRAQPITTTARSPIERDSGPVMKATGISTRGPRLARKLMELVSTLKNPQAGSTTTENEIHTAFCTADMVENTIRAHHLNSDTLSSSPPPSRGDPRSGRRCSSAARRSRRAVADGKHSASHSQAPAGGSRLPLMEQAGTNWHGRPGPDWTTTDVVL